MTSFKHYNDVTDRRATSVGLTNGCSLRAGTGVSHGQKQRKSGYDVLETFNVHECSECGNLLFWVCFPLAAFINFVYFDDHPYKHGGPKSDQTL